MIGKLIGIVDTINESSIILMVNGVGYNVFVPTSTTTRVNTGDNLTLWIETHVREDHIHLYGFATAAEQTWFNTLTTVQGVGAKMGLAILSTLQPNQILNALHSGDKTMFTSVSGVGPKLAERIVTELKSKIKSMTLATPDKIGMTSDTSQQTGLSASAMDAINALESLGYKRAAAYDTVIKILTENGDMPVEKLLPLSLKQLS